MPLGRAWPWTLGLLTLAAGSACSCDCCSVAESHSDWSGAATQTCTLIRSNDERFLAASRHGASECATLCTRSRDDLVLYAAGAEVDSVRFCADECAPQDSGRCAPGKGKVSDGNGPPYRLACMTSGFVRKSCTRPSTTHAKGPSRAPRLSRKSSSRVCRLCQKHSTSRSWPRDRPRRRRTPFR